MVNHFELSQWGMVAAIIAATLAGFVTGQPFEFIVALVGIVVYRLRATYNA